MAPMGVPQLEYHPVVGLRFIPGLRIRVDHEGGGYLVRTNAAGFRSEREFEPARTDGRTRILLFGDSFTAGDGVSNVHRFGDVLETLVPDVEVYNFGLPGTGTDQQYLTYSDIASPYAHDLVVIAVQVENIRRNVAHYRLVITDEGERFLLAKPYFDRQPDETLVLRNVPPAKEAMAPDALPEGERDLVDQGGRLLWLRQTVSAMGAPVKALAQRVMRYQPLPEYDAASHPAWLLMKAILRSWTEDINVPVVIMPVPLYQHVEETAPVDGIRARFAELATWPDVIVHDPMDEYFALPQETRRGFRFATDLHPTPAHHRMLAESLAAVVRRTLRRAPAVAS
jgi:hypothetical protein